MILDYFVKLIVFSQLIHFIIACKKLYPLHILPGTNIYSQLITCIYK
jgi:hypothetical protein